MLTQCVGKALGTSARRWGIASAALAITIQIAAPAAAQTSPSVSIGAGLQTSFVHTEPEDERRRPTRSC